MMCACAMSDAWVCPQVATSWQGSHSVVEFRACSTIVVTCAPVPRTTAVQYMVEDGRAYEYVNIHKVICPACLRLGKCQCQWLSALSLTKHGRHIDTRLATTIKEQANNVENAVSRHGEPIFDKEKGVVCTGSSRRVALWEGESGLVICSPSTD